MNLVFACFGRASWGQQGIQTALCWLLSLVPHKLSLDVGARRVGRGRTSPGADSCFWVGCWGGQVPPTCPAG